MAAPTPAPPTERTRWTRIKQLFFAAAELRVTEQHAFLASCDDDAGVIADVAALLEANARDVSPVDASGAAIAHELLAACSIAERLGPYRIVRLLGEGGMAVVYLAERTDIGRLVAIKLLSDAGLSPARMERFDAERRTLAQLDHPAIARLYDAGTTEDGTPFFVMEYVSGSSLVEHCRARAASQAERLALFRALCEAVQFAHAHAIIHRDLKPSNVLVTADGSVRLLDFGIAKHLEARGAPAEQTRTALRLMTPAYAAPEQLLGEPVGIYTDVYALGVVLYELLAGCLPFDRSRTGELDRAALDRLPERPSIAARGAGVMASKAAWADLDVLVLSAMHPEPERRYRSVDALIRDIDHYVRAEPLEARPDRLGYRARKFVTRHRRPVAAAAVALAALAAVVAFFLLRLGAEHDETRRQAAIAASINRFLAEDFLGRSNPFEGGASAETLIHAIHGAIADVDRRFADEPRVAARLHDIIARSLDARADRASARSEYERAAALYVASDGPLSQDALVVELLRAGLEARSNESGAVEHAREILAAQDQRFARLSRPRPDVARSLHTTHGLVALQSGDPRAAVGHFQAALAFADDADLEARPSLQQRLVWAYVRLNDGPNAEKLAREALAGFTRLLGPDSPRVYLMRQSLVHALLVQRKFADAVAESDRLYPRFVEMVGADHTLILQLLSTRAAAESYLARFDDAARDALEVHRIGARQGDASLWAIVGLSDAGEAQCRAGNIADGTAHARTGRDLALAALRDAQPVVIDGASYALAICLIAARALDAAEEVLQTIDVARLAQAGDAMDFHAAIALARAEIALGRGDRATGEKLLQEATAFARPDAIIYQKRKLESLTALVAGRAGRDLRE